MDILLVAAGLLLIVIGIFGSFLPVLPGPPVSWLGLLMLRFTETIPISTTFLVVTGMVAALIFILDYIIPAAGTKRFGGSRAGAIGTTIGLIIGIFTPIPFGLLIGAFVGALVGEMVFNKSDSKTALKAATGSLLGFLASSFMKFMVCIAFLIMFLSKVISNSPALFGF